MSWFKRTPAKTVGPLVGKWRTDPGDAAALEAYGDVTLDFNDAGNLIYAVHSGGEVEVILMTYTVDGSTVTTDQPSNPGPNTTDFAVSDDVLTLSLDGLSARFVRG